MAALLRTVLITAVAAGVVLFIFWRVGLDQQQKTIDELNALTREMEQKLTEREAMIERLSRSHRLGEIHVLDQRTEADGAITETDIRLIELDDDGRELARQDFTIDGDVLFLDAWTARFSHEDVAAGHPLFGKSLVLLRRIYSERTAPKDGQVIDTPGAVPPGYATSDLGAFEQRLWRDFWQVASDARLAAAMGVRVAQGEAVYKPVKPGQRYELLVDATGGMTMIPLAPGERAVTQVPAGRNRTDG